MMKKIKTWHPANRPKRFPKIPILIACEDSNYSQKYFNSIKSQYRLNNIDVPVRKSVGKSLQQLFEWTIDFHNEKGKKYEEIYLVIDRDMHPDYQVVLNTIKKFRERKGIKIQACVAIPCFEYWLMLHLIETSKPFSSSALMKKEWRKLCDKTYPDKSTDYIFSKITEPTNLLKVIERSKRLQESSDLRADNPSTDIYILIERIIILVDPFNKDLNFTHNFSTFEKIT